ncbi:Ribokinase/fructokinase protein [Dioscorea alata]|uniref:Ribokinase/fructokinase protein n=2 Tax=Dioscorea alata TaxID=55571 RepID=A0ACB7V881_DIOAL|nr:Ribokinase/fructokinase protein [Dioscorea alata]KAH7669710.1 Ribokinase/fructokinase protein [Dioscorea alata]
MLSTLKLCWTFPSSTISFAFPFSSQSRRSRSILPANLRVKMSSSSPSDLASSSSSCIPPLPENTVVLGCGAVALDYLATVASFPKPNDKIRSTSLKVEGGGNVGNALTAAARLGLTPRVISKVANDAQGKRVLAELEADGVDTSHMVVSEEGNSSFTYLIVDSQMKTRTCIHTPGYPPLEPNEISQSSLCSALDGARLVYFDVRLHETAIVVAEEASRRKIPILIDSERKREGLDELLNLASYVVCSENFPQAWTAVSSTPSALVSMLVRLPNLKFVIVTLGEKGCIMLERSKDEAPEAKEKEVESLAESLRQKIDGSSTMPTCISSLPNLRISADGIGAISGRLLLGTAEKIPPEEIIDTTGAGDAFIGAVLYALCADRPPEKMLPFASKVAAAGCRALGARSGLPRRSDPSLAPFWS